MPLALTHSPADILRRLIVEMGLGGDPDVLPLPAWPAYVAGEPNVPDACLTLYDTTPVRDGRTLPDGETLSHYGVQIRIRSVDHPAGWAKASTIRKALDEDLDGAVLTIAGKMYVVYCVAATQILALGKDQPNSKRNLFTLNLTVALRRLS